MDINDLVGLTLDACRFSKSSYDFEFSGKINGEFKLFNVSTSFYFSLPGDKLIDDRKNFSSNVLDFLERKLISTSIDDDKKIPKIIFGFEGDLQFIIYCPGEEFMDNMLIITDKITGSWFTVL